MFGISAGIVPGMYHLYIDEPFDIWPSRLTSPVYHLFYARQVSGSLRVGSYYEYEQARFTQGSSEGVFGFDRYNLRVNWLSMFPQRAFHLQLGAYLGYGFLKAQNWDRLTGPDIGLIAGPAYESKRVGAAVHFEAGHAWYRSGGTPSGVMLYSPKILLKIYYRFDKLKLRGAE